MRQATVMSFCISFSMLTVWMLGSNTAAGQTLVTVNSLSQLREYASVDDHIVTLAAGDYWLEGDGLNETFIALTGNNSVYDFTEANLYVDTRDLAGYGSSNGHADTVNLVGIYGNGLTVHGLTLEGVDVDVATDPNARRHADWLTNFMRIEGLGNTVKDTRLVVRGSSPFGYGDEFGKGSAPAGANQEGGVPFIGHKKGLGIQITGGADGTVIDGLDLDMYAFGHGVYIQNAANTTIKNATVTGQTFDIQDVIEHPLYQQYGVSTYGVDLEARGFGGIQISGSEDGIRVYGEDAGGLSENLVLDNVIVENMREAFSTFAAGGNVTINNSAAYGNEFGYEPGSNTTITNSKGDVVNGPLLYFRREGATGNNIEIELVGDIPQVGLNWDVAYISGESGRIKLTSSVDPDLLAEDAYVRVAQRFNHQRDPVVRDLDIGRTADSLEVINLTGQILVLGSAGQNITGSSNAGVINGGDNNRYDGVTLILPGAHMVADHSASLGNEGSSATGTMASNGSIVFAGGTLELQSGAKINNEQLTISGDGVDGRGALYSEGSVGTQTRFGDSNASNESVVVLDGNASIGVGVEGQQMLIGEVRGEGNLTKRGAGTLTVEKPSTLDGELIVAEGTVLARRDAVPNGLSVAAGAVFAVQGDRAINRSSIPVDIDGTLDLNARTDTTDLTVLMGRLNGSGRITISNPNSDAHATLTIAGESHGQFSGSIDGQISLNKTGSGTLALTGNTSYRGITEISNGTVLVEGVHAGGGGYTLRGGGTLGGSGTIELSEGAGITLLAGGSLAPGGQGIADPLTLMIEELNMRDALSLKGSPALVFYFDPDGRNSYIKVDGRISIGEAGLEFDDLAIYSDRPIEEGTYILLESELGISGSLGEEIMGRVGGRSAALILTNHTLAIHVEVPEPSTIFVVGGVLPYLAARRKSRSRTLVR